jgi:hypothetical protein
VSCSSSDKSDKSPPMETAASSIATPPPATANPADTSVTQSPDTAATQVSKTSTRAKPAAPPAHKPVLKRAPTSPSAAPAVDTATAATPTTSAATTSDAPAHDKFLSFDPATNTVTFELVAGPFTFDGHRNGDATLVVPPRANIVMNFVNKDGTPHSAIVISGEGPIPNAATDPAIPRAYTNKVLEGLPQEATDVMRFPAPDSGTYRIFCGVPGHGLSGMWIWMKVDPAAKTPSFGPTKA